MASYTAVPMAQRVRLTRGPKMGHPSSPPKEGLGKNIINTIYRVTTVSPTMTSRRGGDPLRLDLHTILPSPILYGVWHTKGGLVGGGVYCERGVQKYCYRVGFASGGATNG